MASITTSVVLLRWPLVSAVLMFLASSLNIQLRKSDYAGLAVICSCLGLAAACWFAPDFGHIKQGDTEQTGGEPAGGGQAEAAADHRFARYHPARYCQNLGQYQRCDD